MQRSTQTDFHSYLFVTLLLMYVFPTFFNKALLPTPLTSTYINAAFLAVPVNRAVFAAAASPYLVNQNQ